jgi:DNA-binding transcriptional LysR family regulator
MPLQTGLYDTAMKTVDLNLLGALDVLLAERSVTGAARRLGLSPSAMSRTLARLRAATGDPLLVQAGRALVATPYADELGGKVHELARQARAVLSPVARRLDPAVLQRTFTVRANEGFLTLFSARLASAISQDAPLVRLRFMPKPDKDAGALRDGRIDLEIGTAGASAPEVRSRLIFRDTFVGAARRDHPLFTGRVTAECYAAYGHVVASRRGVGTGPVDEALGALGLKREIMVVVPGFPDAMNIARCSDLIALVPQSCLAGASATDDLRAFHLPVATPELAISVMWHPRLDADAAHRWLRQKIIAACSQDSG